jgi:hypothetical protein
VARVLKLALVTEAYDLTETGDLGDPSRIHNGIGGRDSAQRRAASEIPHIVRDVVVCSSSFRRIGDAWRNGLAIHRPSVAVILVVLRLGRRSS